ncbi:hypothetical protein [Alkalihalobacillus alcalophilus]|uniref:hypothetical protein n=1 Tax=Alkalihalobacillus alcalophilus TaxID=1445 RepID=UPI0012690AAF|nr:hypothetical protein [Alkalihalobacillus alcalophilus]
MFTCLVFCYPFWLFYPIYLFIELPPLAMILLSPLVSAILFSIGILMLNVNIAKSMYQYNQERSVTNIVVHLQLRTVGVIYIFILSVYSVLLLFN